MKRRPLQLGLALALGVGLGLAGFVLAHQRSANSQRSPHELAGPLRVTAEMIDAWCVDTFGETYRASNLAGGEPQLWRCWGRANGIVTEEGVDMVNLCQEHFGGDVTAEINAASDSWECVAAADL